MCIGRHAIAGRKVHAELTKHGNQTPAHLKDSLRLRETPAELQAAVLARRSRNCARLP